MAADTIIRLRNQEVSAQNSRLTAKDETIAELGEQIDKLESELAAELSDLKQKSTAAGKDLPDAADILKNLRKALGKKSTASLADVEKILEILEEG
ncbi:hypothetical protein [Microcoleus sp. B3-D7]|uniref:hypothetical protein n=1 Tax=Microcoleus sp. B3-D7 TaxID=2818659 RepID=UPI002FD567B5